MHPALFKLLRLRARALVRKIYLGLRSPRRAALTIITLGFVVMQTSFVLIGTLSGSDDIPINPALLSTWLPVGLMLLFVYQVFSPNGQNLMAFSPSEMQFLYPGPFTRRHLILYKILGGMGVLTLVSLFMSLVALRFGAIWLCSFTGVFLYLAMGFLSGIAVSLAMKDVSTRFGWWFLGLLMAAFLIAGAAAFRFYFDDVLSGPLAIAQRLRESIFFIVFLAPFRVFAEMIMTQSLGMHFAGNLALALGMSLAALLSIFKLDANFLELSVKHSQRRQKRIERFKSGKAWSRARARSGNLSVPAFPRWGGVGPIVRRQALAVVRGPVAWKILAIAAMAGAFVGYIARSADISGLAGRGELGLMAVMAYAMLFLPALVRYDFRSEAECFDRLKTLPLPALPIAIGELLVPVTVVTLCQVIFCATFAIGKGVAPLNPLFIFVLFSVNGLVYAVENAFFLVFPTRNAMVTMADTAEFGRRLLVFMLKMAVLLLVGGLAGGSGALVYYLTSSIGGAVFSGWTVVMLCLGVSGLLVAKAFKRLDPSVDFG